MAVLEINWRPSRTELRWFAALWFPLACVTLGGLLWWRLGLRTAPYTLWTAAAVLSPLAWFVPPLAQALYLTWMTLALPIGWVISHLIFAIIYYLVLTPIGLLMRLTGRDTMQRKFDQDAETYWQKHERTEDAGRYLKQY